MPRTGNSRQCHPFVLFEPLLIQPRRASAGNGSRITSSARYRCPLKRNAIGRNGCKIHLAKSFGMASRAECKKAVRKPLSARLLCKNGHYGQEVSNLFPQFGGLQFDWFATARPIPTLVFTVGLPFKRSLDVLNNGCSHLYELETRSNTSQNKVNTKSNQAKISWLIFLAAVVLSMFETTELCIYIETTC